MKQRAEFLVACALRDCARQLVAVAQDPAVVEVANEEWKRQNKRIQRLEAELSQEASETPVVEAA